MISMTAYWQLFNACILNLPQVKNNQDYTRQIHIAKNMIQIGLRIEKQGITDIKQVVNRLHAETQKFNNPVSYTNNGQHYDFNLPQINSRESLIFAIVYYQHLKNYSEVSYQGSISFLFKSLVISAVDEKKEPTRCQSLVMLEKIKAYAADNAIAIDEHQLDKATTEKAPDYILRLIKQFIPPEVPAKIKVQVPEPLNLRDSFVDEAIRKWEKALKTWQVQHLEIQKRIDEFDQKLSDYQAASQQFHRCHQTWQQLSWFTQCYYWIKSWFYSVELLDNIKQSARQYAQAEKVLHDDIHGDDLQSIEVPPPRSTAEDWNRHRQALRYSMQSIQQECKTIQDKLQHTKWQQLEQNYQLLHQKFRELQQEKQEIQSQHEDLLIKLRIPQDTSEGMMETDLSDTTTSEAKVPPYYNFFNTYTEILSTHIGALAAEKLFPTPS